MVFGFKSESFFVAKNKFLGNQSHLAWWIKNVLKNIPLKILKGKFRETKKNYLLDHLQQIYFFDK
jgi:hypothetical protein